jgi:predicted phage terminase large subunit-like protein
LKAMYELRDGLPVFDVTNRVFTVPGKANPWPFKLMFQAVESKSSGIGVIQQGRADGKPFRELKAGQSSKELRAMPVITKYANGQVWHNVNGHWLAAFEKELLTFPTGATTDQVDALAYAGILCAVDPMLNGGHYTGDLLLWPDVPRDEQGRPVTWEDLRRAEGDVLNVGGTVVDFAEEESRGWWDSR